MRVPFTRKFSRNEKAAVINQEKEKVKAISQLCADFRPGVKLPVAASIVDAARRVRPQGASLACTARRNTTNRARVASKEAADEAVRIRRC